MTLKIRQATKADAEVISQLGAKTFYDTFRQFHSEEDIQLYIGKTYSREVVEKNMAIPEVIYLIGESGNKPLGYAKLKLNVQHELLKGKTIELEKIYVLKDYLGTGCGAELMKTAIHVAKECQCDVLFLGVWQENKRAVDFYDRFGFEIFTTRQFQLGTESCDDHLMKLML